MAPRAYISRQLYERVKLSDRHAADLAELSGLDASTLSLVINRRRKVRTNDPRIIKLGRLVGVKKADLFESDEQQQGAA